MYTLVYDAYARRVMRHCGRCGDARASGALGDDGDGGRGDDGAVKGADFPVKRRQEEDDGPDELEVRTAGAVDAQRVDVLCDAIDDDGSARHTRDEDVSRGGSEGEVDAASGRGFYGEIDDWIVFLFFKRLQTPVRSYRHVMKIDVLVCFRFRRASARIRSHGRFADDGHRAAIRRRPSPPRTS